jgi:hypothetical protein
MEKGDNCKHRSIKHHTEDDWGTNEPHRKVKLIRAW